MKKIFENFIIYLCRHNYTINKAQKISLYSIFIYIFLLLTIGVSWHFKPKFSMHINLLIWWSLIFLLNLNTLFLYLYRKNLLKIHSRYIDKLYKEKKVIVGYPDPEFTLGQIFTCGYNETFNGHYMGNVFIEREKIFKFIPLKKNRKLKLQKLANLTK